MQPYCYKAFTEHSTNFKKLKYASVFNTHLIDVFVYPNTN